MNDDRHLTEDERQAFVDDAVPAERRTILEAHLATCRACSDDVARLRNVTMRYRSAPDESGTLDELWPSIRTRIERDKVVSLGSTPRITKRWLRTRHAVAFGALAAGAMLTVVLLRPSHRIAVDSTVAVSDTGRIAARHRLRQVVRRRSARAAQSARASASDDAPGGGRVDRSRPESDRSGDR